MQRHFYSRFMLLAALSLITVYLVSAVPPAPAAQEGIPDRPLPGLSQELDHYSENLMPPAVAVQPLSPEAPTGYVPWSKLVFQSYRDSNWEIYFASSDGSNPARLTNNGVPDIHPHLNRGATRVVFSGRLGGDYEIYAINPNGSGLVQLTNNNTDDVNPDWSGDGSRIVFESYRDGQPEIYVMNADGSNQIRLTADADYDGMPVWSPGGLKIAFVSRRTGGYRIYTIAPEGGSLAQISDQPYSLYPAWSPDGGQIAYSADQDGDGFLELWRISSSGTNAQVAFDPAGQVDAWARSWSSEGKYIGFTQIGFIFFQGNWYWTEAYLDGWSTVNGLTFHITSNDLDWNPGWQTTDAQKPVSTINSLPGQSPGPFLVTWTGSDTGPSGFANFDVQVKDGANGSWATWLSATTATAAHYPGIGGHTYYFRVRARDNAANLEAWPANFDATTTVEALPPQSYFVGLPAYLYHQSPIHWGSNDPGGSAIAAYDIQYKQGAGGSWVNWQMNTTNTSADFEGTPGQTYYFRIRARDTAQNEEAWPAGNGDASTTLYSASLVGRISDNAGVPVTNATITSNPAAIGALANDPANGTYSLFLAANNDFTAGWSKNGYGPLPLTSFAASPVQQFDVVMPPADNVIQNPSFEAGNLASWQNSGLYAPTVTNTIKHTGNKSAFFGLPFALGEATVIPGTEKPEDPYMLVDDQGVTHLVWEQFEERKLYYSRLINGVWSQRFLVADGPFSFAGRLVVDSNGAVHVVWVHFNLNGNVGTVYHRVRQPNGTWTAPSLITSTNSTISFFELAIDQNDTIHLLLHYQDTHLHTVSYTRRPLTGSWSPLQTVFAEDQLLGNIAFSVANEGMAHVLWGTINGNIYHAFRSPSGNWSAATLIGQALVNTSDLTLIADEQGAVHALWNDWGQGIFYARRSLNGAWSNPLAVNTPPAGEWPRMAVSLQGEVHVIWTTGNGVLYSRRDIGGNWSQPAAIPDGPQLAEWPALGLDEAGTVYVAWADNLSKGQWQVYLSYHERNGEWSDPLLLDSSVIYDSYVYYLQLASGPAGSVQVQWYDVGLGGYSMFHAGSAPAAQAGQATLSQTIHLSNTLTSPALSFLYQLAGMSADNRFTVSINNGSGSIILLDSNEGQGSWEHQSFDLTPWLGQTITLTFQLNQAINAPRTSALLDEVTIGSTHPDLWLRVTGNSSALPGEPLVYTFSYGNQGDAAATSTTISHTLPAELTFLSASLPPISTSPLVWDVGNLPAKSGPFTIVVTATVSPSADPFTDLTLPVSIATGSAELETANNIADFVIHLIRALFLPIITR